MADNPAGSEEESNQEDDMFSLDDLDDMLDSDDGSEAEVEAAPAEKKIDPFSVLKAQEEEKANALEEESKKRRTLGEMFPKIHAFVLKVKRPLEKPTQFLGKIKLKLMKLSKSGITELIVYLKVKFPERVKYFVEHAKLGFGKTKEILAKFNKLNKGQKIAIIGLVFIFTVFLSLFKETIVGSIWWPQIFKPDVKSLIEFTKVIHKYNPDEDMVFLYNAFSQPHYTFLLEGVVVNLKRSTNSTRLPMVRMEIFLDLDSAETAIEVKDRKMEIKDYVSRLIEEFSYDQLLSKYGKKQLKINIKSKVNEILNEGLVREVYFKEFVYKR